MLQNSLYWLVVVFVFIALFIKSSHPVFMLFVVSFLITFLATRLWIKRAKKAGLVGKDLHKLGFPEVAELGGIPILIGFFAGVLVLIALRIFYFNAVAAGGLTKNDPLLQIMALLLTVMFAAFIGIIDDILGWKIGIKQWQKPILVLFAALPLSAIDIGHSIMKLPFIGPVDFEFLFPFIIVPIGITVAANGFNLIAGYNGLEAGLGMIILGALGYVAYIRDISHVAIISFCMVVALLAFFYFNKFPAKIFPGDVMTYSIGALAGGLAILGNMEKIVLILYIPYIIEFFMKGRGLFKKESFARLSSNDTLTQPYKNIYGLEHLAINLLGRFNSVKENNVVYFILGLELIFAILAIASVNIRFGLLN